MYTFSLLKGQVQKKMQPSDSAASLSLSVAQIKNMSVVYF